MNNCLGVVIILFVLLTAVVLVYAAPPANLYSGGECDGYDSSGFTNNVIPLPPPKGTVVAIQ